MRYYSSTAVVSSLASAVTAGATTLTLSSLSGYPSNTPFTLVLDPSTAQEEIVYVASRSGDQVTVQRGREGTAPVAHTMGAVVRHMVTGTDLQLSRNHEEADAGVHGLAPGDAVVGASASQTLLNKVISGAGNALSNIPISAVTGLSTDLGSLTSRLESLRNALGTQDSGWQSVATRSSWTGSIRCRKVGKIVTVSNQSAYRNTTMNSGETHIATLASNYTPSENQTSMGFIISATVIQALPVRVLTNGQIYTYARGNTESLSQGFPFRFSLSYAV